MTITARSGPDVVFGITQGSTGQVSQYNEERGVSLYDLGTGMLDPRYQFNYKPGAPVGTPLYGFYADMAYVDFVPMTAQTSAIAVSSSNQPVAGTALTLTAAASGIGTYQTTIIAPETGKATGNLLALDSTAAYLSFGTGNAGGPTGTSTGGTIAIWNPAAGAGRTIQITLSSTAPDIGAWTIAGRDVYGFKMTESINTGQAGSTAISTYAGLKAFKYISAVTPASSTTINSTGVGVGFTDTFGFPLLVKNTGMGVQTRLIVTASLQYPNSSGPITLGTTVATNLISSGPDVRGTYASTAASDNSKRLQLMQMITPAMVSAVTASDVSALFGGTQFSSV